MERFFLCSALGVAVGVVSLTITRAVIFREFRRWVGRFPRGYYLHELITCPYCTSHWVAGLTALFLRLPVLARSQDYPPVFTNIVPNVIFEAGVMVAAAMLTCGMVRYAIEFIGPSRDEPEED